jgi:transposase InsO family protein
MTSGLTLEGACDEVGVSVRTVERWRAAPCKGDERRGPRHTPPNALSAVERARVLRIANSPEFVDRSPKQIVPALADRGEYVASESTFYRILRAAGQLAHRERSKPREPRPVPTHTADGPNQLWSWDITYLKSQVRGCFFFLYMFVDVWSRKVVGWAVHEAESDEHSAVLARECCRAEGVADGLVLHSDNGGPMRGSTMLATLQRLGVVPSFSRPRVSDDNPYSEALFRTLKYTPAYPSRPFATVEDVRVWVGEFVRWYNTEHLHSGIRFVTPAERHRCADAALLARRAAVYEAARRARPERWATKTRDWQPIGPITFNRPRAHHTEAAAA